MTDLLPVEPAALPAEENPVEYMLTVLNRAKGWLAEAASIDDVRNAKAIAVGYEAVIREKELAFDAQLAATEIVRRCERRIGELVREGQARGEIRVRGSNQYDAEDVRNAEHPPMSPRDATGIAAKAVLSEHYLMADTEGEDFERAVAEAREEGNLSRANVVRKVKGGDPAPQPRSEWHRNTRHIDADRILRETALSLRSVTAGLDLCNAEELDVLEKLDWIESIKQDMKKLQSFVRRVGRG